MKGSIEEERWGWIAPIINKELTYTEVLKLCPHGKRSLERWVAAYRRDGMAGLTPKSTTPKTHPNETSIRLKEEVVARRKKHGKCALKLHWELEKEGVHIHERTIGNIG
jgi:transposase